MELTEFELLIGDSDHLGCTTQLPSTTMINKIESRDLQSNKRFELFVALLIPEREEESRRAGFFFFSHNNRDRRDDT